MAKILGVRVDDIGIYDALKKTREFLNDGRQYTVFTPNPEMLVVAYKDQRFRDVLNRGSLNICDGIGVKLFGRLKNRVPGVEFMQELCRVAEEDNKKIYLLGGDKGVAERVSKKLEGEFPKLNIVGYSFGITFTIEECNKAIVGEIIQGHEVLLQEINSSRADILFVAFGHEKQEKWIDINLSKLPYVKIAMGVGGSFDFISQDKIRAPKWMRSIGLEWFYRLLLEPKRLGRIVTAVLVFPWFVLRSKF